MNLSPAPVLPDRVYPPDSLEFFQTGSVPLQLAEYLHHTHCPRWRVFEGNRPTKSFKLPPKYGIKP